MVEPWLRGRVWPHGKQHATSSTHHQDMYYSSSTHYVIILSTQNNDANQGCIILCNLKTSAYGAAKIRPRAVDSSRPQQLPCASRNAARDGNGVQTYVSMQGIVCRERRQSRSVPPSLRPLFFNVYSHQQHPAVHQARYASVRAMIWTLLKMR